MDNNKSTNERKPFVNLPCDSVYALYRTMRQAEQDKHEQDPNAPVTASGIILLSNEQEDSDSYSMMAAAFGTEENILTSLSLFILNNIKEHAGASREKRNESIRSYLKFFVSTANSMLFGDD